MRYIKDVLEILLIIKNVILRDLKSLGRKAVPVRVRSRAPEDNPTKCEEVQEALKNQGFFCLCCPMQSIVVY